MYQVPGSAALASYGREPEKKIAGSRGRVLLVVEDIHARLCAYDMM